jgi:uncharacterized membrane protein YgcG
MADETHVPTSSPRCAPAGRTVPKRRRTGPPLEWWVGAPVFVVALAVAAVAAYRLPVRAPATTPAQALEERIRKGPDSYFHHVFDPDGLLGPLGQTDLTLDNFERETSHGVLLAALPHVPPDAPELAMHAAEVWQPGVAGADNGIVVFVFPADRRVQLLVGYGLEPVLPDAEAERLLAATFLPAARAGNLSGAVEALVPPLLARLRPVPRATPRHHPGLLHDLAVTAQEVPRRARFVEAVWLANPPKVRLILSVIGTFAVALFAALLARVAYSGWLLVRLVRARAGGCRIAGAAGEVVASLLRPAQIAAVLFVMVIGTSFFFPGTGAFGGGGVNLGW